MINLSLNYRIFIKLAEKNAMKSSIFKPLFLSFLFLVFSINANAANFKYKSSEGRMSVKFPSQYTVVTENPDYGKTVKINAEFGAYIFSATYTIHSTSSSGSDPESLANVSLGAFSESLKGNISNKQVWKIKKNNGIRAVIKSDELNISASYACIMIGQIQYQLVVASASDSWVDGKGDAFFESFKAK